MAMKTIAEQIAELEAEISLYKTEMQQKQAHIKETEEGGNGNRFRMITDNVNLSSLIKEKEVRLTTLYAMEGNF